MIWVVPGSGKQASLCKAQMADLSDAPAAKTQVWARLIKLFQMGKNAHLFKESVVWTPARLVSHILFQVAVVFFQRPVEVLNDALHFSVWW